MADNEVAIKITGDASELKGATDSAKEQLKQAGESVDMLGELIGVKVPGAIKDMLASSELIAPALDAAFAPLAVISLGVAIFDATEKAEKHREEMEKSRLEAIDVALSFDKQAESVQISNLKLEDHIATLERRPAQNGIAIAAEEGQRAIEDLTKTFQDAINKENELLTKEEQGFFSKFFFGESGVDAIKPQLTKYQDEINETLTALRLAQAEHHSGETITFQAALDQQLIDYKQFLGSQIIENNRKRQSDINAANDDIRLSTMAGREKLMNAQQLAMAESVIADRAGKKQAEINAQYDKTEQQLRSVLVLLANYGRTSQEIGKHSALEGAAADAENAAKALKQMTEMEKLFFELSREEQRKSATEQQSADKEAIASIDRKNKAFLKGIADQAAASEAFLQGEIKNAQADEKIQEQLIEQRYLKGQITQQEEISVIAKAKQAEIATELAYEREILSLWHKDEKEKEAILARISNLTKQAQLVETKSVTDGIKAQEQQYRQFFQQIGSALSSNVQDMLKGTETIAQGFQKMYQSLIGGLIDYVAQKAEKKAEEWAIEQLFGKKKAAANVGQATSNVGVAASEALASVEWPFNIAAAAETEGVGASFEAQAGVAFWAAGTNYVPMDGLAYLHKGEQIIPASQQGPAYNGSVGGITVVVNHSVSAVDAASFQGHIRRHSNMIANEVTRALKRKGVR